MYFFTYTLFKPFFYYNNKQVGIYLSIICRYIVQVIPESFQNFKKQVQYLPTLHIMSTGNRRYLQYYLYSPTIFFFFFFFICLFITPTLGPRYLENMCVPTYLPIYLFQLNFVYFTLSSKEKNVCIYFYYKQKRIILTVHIFSYIMIQVYLFR